MSLPGPSMPSPVRYDPGVERIQPNERENVEELSRTFRDVQENVLRRKGEARHGTHAKATALLKGTLEVSNDLPPELAQGLFARPGRHELLARFRKGPAAASPTKRTASAGLAMWPGRLIDSILSPCTLWACTIVPAVIRP